MRSCLRLERASFRAAILALATLSLLGISLQSDAHSGEAAPSGVKIDKTFDHNTTAFPLTGKHVTVTCESCHYNAVFKGVGRLCNDCHNGKASPSGEKVSSKPADHIPASNACAECHNTETWKTVRVNHRNLSEVCATCHNGKSATGKPLGHVPSTANCKGCHNTSTWLPVRMDHSDAAGPCALCHDGRRAQGQSANHIKTSENCETCHTVLAWKPAGFAHTGITGNCTSCHNGLKAKGKVSAHFLTNQPCELCHDNFVTFSGAFMVHVGISSGCATCHNGRPFQGKGKNPLHIPTSQPCELCHDNFVTFSGAFMNHQGISSGCALCHDNIHAKGKNAGHEPTTKPCEDCHDNFVTFTGATGRRAPPLPPPATSRPMFFKHAVPAGACTTCHNGKSATGKSAAHFLSARACDACHAVAAWKPLVFRHTSSNYPNGHAVTLACKSCHTTNAEIVPYKMPALKSTCAGCHAANFKPAPHQKYLAPRPMSYSLFELKDCSGACHVYTDSTLRTIKERRVSHHRAGSGGF